MTETARVPKIGPRIVTIAVESCEGCPALRFEAWTDNMGPHRSASCAALPSAALGAAPTLITSYWRHGRPVPLWCPARSRA